MERISRVKEREKLMEMLGTGKRYAFQDILKELFAEEDRTDKNTIWLRQCLTTQCKAGKIQHEGREYFLEGVTQKKRGRKKGSAAAKAVVEEAPVVEEAAVEESPVVEEAEEEITVEDAAAEEAVEEAPASDSGLYGELVDTINALYAGVEKADTLLHNSALYAGLSVEEMDYVLGSVMLIGELCDTLYDDEEDEQ